MVMEKITRQQIENALDDKIVDIYVEPSMEKIERFGTAVRICIKGGYILRDYLTIYEELKKDFYSGGEKI